MDPQTGQCCLPRFELGAVDRQLPNSLARRGEDRVGDRRYYRRRTRLTDAPRRLRALDQMDVDQRRLVNAQHPIVIEIALLDAAVLNRDLAEQGGRVELGVDIVDPELLRAVPRPRFFENSFQRNIFAFVSHGAQPPRL
jgi:hypothetical protein